MSINAVSISGNLTRDPELKQLPSGMAVLGIGVAVNERRKSAQTGEWEDYPNFVEVTVFGNRATALSRFLAKGMKVAVSGRLRQDRWEKDGQKRSKLVVIADEVDVMSRSQQGQAPQYQPQQAPQQYAPQQYAPQQAMAPQQPTQPQYQQPQYQQPQYQQPQAAPGPDMYDEDIPF